jgi:hypothetical protein
MTAIVFDYIIPIRRKAVARKSDPQVSHDAAKRVELGKAEQLRRCIKATLQAGGPSTCTELAELIYFLPYPVTSVDVGKRISEIEGIAPTGEVRNGSRVWGLV